MAEEREGIRLARKPPRPSIYIREVICDSIFIRAFECPPGAS